MLPLLSHLPPGATFCEPCAGDGRLIDHLRLARFQCVAAYDIEPQAPGIVERDARLLTPADLNRSDLIITNPPWERKTLHALIESLSSLAPTWLLFDAGWAYTVQSRPFMPLLRKIVSVGRVKWIEDSPFTGKDDCAWYLFDAGSAASPPQFYNGT